MSMKTAVIGLGRMGQTHLQAAGDLGLKVVGVCDASADALRLAGDACDIPAERRFADAQTMLDKSQPECVIVATTSPAHCSYTCLAAEAGVGYILCEKPMAISLDQCDRMLETCRARGARLAINHQMRFMEQYTEPRRIVYSEEFGGLSSVVAVAGNFGMAMNGTHYFEMFRFMAGEPPVEATAWFSEERVPNPRGPQFEDRAGSVRMTTASGVRFYLEIGSDQGHGMKVVYSGPYGQLVVDELAGTGYLSVRREEDRPLPATRYGTPPVERVIRIEPADNLGPTRAVLQALLDGSGPPTGEEGRLAVAGLVAAYVSHEVGHAPVRLDAQDLPVERVFPWA